MPQSIAEKESAHPQSPVGTGALMELHSGPDFVEDWKPHTAPPRDADGNDIYDHEKYPLGPPSIGKYKPKVSTAKYRLLVGQFLGEDGILYIAGRNDIVPEQHKHPLGLARWPEKFQRLAEDRFTEAVQKKETIEELEARLAEMRAAKNNPPPSPTTENSTLDHMTVEELKKYAEEQEYNVGGARSKDQLLKLIKQIEGVK